MTRDRLMAVVLTVGIAGLAGWGVVRHDFAAGTLEPLTIGLVPHEMNALLYVAEDQHLFANHGLRVTLKDYDSGRAAVTSLLAHQIDLATASEFVVVEQGLGNAPVRALATIARSNTIYLLARHDRGIRTPADLPGKRVALPRGTSVEFCFGRLLTLHGLDSRQVTIVDTPPTALGDALAEGIVDAVVVWQPIAERVKAQLGNGLAVWPAQSGQLAYWTLIGTEGWAPQHRRSAGELMRALTEAEQFVLRHPDRARALVQQRLHYSDALMTAVWPETTVGLSLDQSFVLAMEDMGRWMIAEQRTAATVAPDAGRLLDPAPLRSARPDNVNLFAE